MSLQEWFNTSSSLASSKTVLVEPLVFSWGRRLCKPPGIPSSLHCTSGADETPWNSSGSSSQASHRHSPYVLLMLNGRAFIKAAMQVGETRQVCISPTLICRGRGLLSQIQREDIWTQRKEKSFHTGAAGLPDPALLDVALVQSLEDFKRVLAISMLTRIRQIKTGWGQGGGLKSFFS